MAKIYKTLEIKCRDEIHQVRLLKNRKVELLNHDNDDIVGEKVVAAFGGAACPCVFIQLFAEKYYYLKSIGLYRYCKCLEFVIEQVNNMPTEVACNEFIFDVLAAAKHYRNPYF